MISVTSRAAQRRALTRLRAEGTSPQAIDRLLADNPIPLIEGTACTFLWRGRADAVAVEHRVVGLPAPLWLQRLRMTDLWYATVELPLGSRVEYRLVVRRGDHTENIEDPLNPQRAEGPMGTTSVLLTTGYTTPDWTLHDAAVVPGELIELNLPSRALRREAYFSVYLPARLRRDDRLPLLIAHDGGDYLNHAALRTVLDNLMHRRLMADCIVALTHPVDRLKEYGANPAHGRFLTAELVPYLEQRLPLRGEPPGRVLAGASFGAIASLSAATRAPGFYGGLLLQSASFLYTVVGREHEGGPVFDPVVRFVNELRANPRPAVERAFLSIGAFEPSADRNRAMLSMLQGLAGEVRVVEGLDGHTWTGWRDRLLDGLSWLFPGEARFVYP